MRLIGVFAMLILAITVNLNRIPINDTISSSVANREPTSGEIVGLSMNESWPILRIDFPGKTFPNSKLQNFFEGELSASKYIEEMSGGHSTLEITIIDGIWSSNFDESHWGSDSSVERDVGINSGGASQLASNAIVNLLSDSDLSKWDLNGDFVVDRLLILHSGMPQEQGGTSSAIWSHFSPLQEPVTIGEYTIEHYTMASAHGGLGVIVHEMLHQMGAVDLYDVHSDSPTKSWHGLGDWGVMASGNWIDDGNRPSLPSSSTLKLIGAINSTPIIENRSNLSFDLKPISSGGSPLYFEIAEGEYIWVTFRSDLGFDSGLPGSGIIVEQQDTSFGDIESNLVNSDPSKPWSKIIEADGDDALLRARDYGSNSDAFQNGDVFGHSGYQIWDNHGRLVPWTITVISVNTDSAQLRYDYFGDDDFEITTPKSPVALMINESFSGKISMDSDCEIYFDFSTSGTEFKPYFEEDSSHIVMFEASESDSRKGSLTGLVGCKDRSLTEISIEWDIINHRLSTKTLEAEIPWDSESTVSFTPEAEGDGPRTYSISVDGPAGRVADVITSGRYFPGDPIILQIDPNDLLEPRMIARGEMVLVDSNNIEQRIPIVLNTEGSLPFGPFNWLTVPTNAITAVLLLVAFTIATGKGKEVD